MRGWRKGEKPFESQMYYLDKQVYYFHPYMFSFFLLYRVFPNKEIVGTDLTTLEGYFYVINIE